MRTKFPFLLSLAAATPLLAHCVPTEQDITNLDLRVRNIESRMVAMNQKVDDTTSKTAHLIQGSPVEQLQAKQADLNNQIDRMNNELLQLRAMIEESETRGRTQQTGSKESISRLNERMTALEGQIARLGSQPAKAAEPAAPSDQPMTIDQLKAAEEKARSVAADDAARVAREDEKKTPPPAAKTAGPPEIGPDRSKKKVEDGKKPEEDGAEAGAQPGKEIYDKGIALFRESKFNEAYRTFSDYIERHPKGKLAPNARFWLGDCYYNQQEFELAILEYQKVIADYPDSPKAPAALLKQGLAFEKLKDKETAKIVYKKVVADYPKSEQVETAKKRIEELK